MAGRPVSVHGTQPLLYWVIVFVILTVASLGGFIFQLTNTKGLKNRAERAEARTGQFGEPPSYYSEEARSRSSKVFAVMKNDLEDLAFLVTGVKQDVLPGVQTKAQRVLKQLATDNTGVINENDTLLTALEQLNRETVAQRLRADERQATVTSLQAEKDTLTEQLNSARQQFEAQIAELQRQLEQTRNEQVAALADKDQQLSGLQASLNACEQQQQRARREGNTVIRDKDVEIDRLGRQIALLQKQIQDLKPSTFDPNAILTKADGRVSRAVPGSDVLYVDIGTADKIKIGMGFEVYSQTREARPELRGKASIEVVTAMEHTSECRIIRRDPSQPIIEGDLVVNIAFERTRQPKFVVRGEFDLDYDDKPDFDGPRQIANLIREWGGQVVDDIDETVDFVVIGRSPTGPPPPEGELWSDIMRDQARRQQLAGLEFYQLIERATAMYIPVMTQNQFLYLTGYAGRLGR